MDLEESLLGFWAFSWDRDGAPNGVLQPSRIDVAGVRGRFADREFPGSDAQTVAGAKRLFRLYAAAVEEGPASARLRRGGSRKRAVGTVNQKETLAVADDVAVPAADGALPGTHVGENEIAAPVPSDLEWSLGNGDGALALEAIAQNPG